MKVGIIEAGVPPSSLVPAFGTYDTMTRRLLGEAYAYETFCACDGVLPSDVLVCDAYVITGSAAGVNDGDPWIEDLAAFARAARGRVKLIGICFGHQLLAHAFGGTVRKAEQGWGVGLHRYQIVAPAPWMDDVAAIEATASHQDQVIVPAPGSTVHAASAFTAHAILGYDDAMTMSCQFHPEFEPAFSRALLEARCEARLEEADLERAVDSFDAPNDNVRLGRWLRHFLDGAPGDRSRDG